MSTTTGYEPAAGLGTGHIASPEKDQARLPFVRRYYAVAAVFALPLLALGLPHSSVNKIAQLERLALRIERSAPLTGEARSSIARLVTRQSAVAAGALESRRKAAIARITRALNARQTASVGRGGHGPAAD